MKIISCRKCKLLLNKNDAIEKPVVVETIREFENENYGVDKVMKLVVLYYCPNCGKSELLNDRDKTDFVRIRYNTEDGLDLDKTLFEFYI